jgi:O-antigen ligase
VAKESWRLLRLAEWLLIALVFALPLVRPFNLSLFEFTLPPSDFIFIVAAIVWVAALIAGQTEFRRSRFYLPLALYLSAMIVSTVLSEDVRRSAIKLAGETYLIGLAVLTFNLVTSIQILKRVMIAWLAGTFVTVLVGVAGVILFYAGVRSHYVNLALSGYGSLPPGNYPRIQALFDNMNMLCNYLNVSLVIALIAYLEGWLSRRVFLAFSFALWACAFFTFSPGLGGMFLSAALWARMKDSGKRLGVIVASMLATAFFLAATISPVSTGQRQFLILPSTQIRIEPSSRALTWQSSLETIRRHPVFGRGVGLEVADVTYLAASGFHQHLTDAHNVWLSVAGQEGIVGALALVSVVVFLLKGIRWFKSNASIHASLAMAFIGAFLYQGLSGSFEDARHIWVLIGMLAAVKEWLVAERSSALARLCPESL